MSVNSAETPHRHMDQSIVAMCRAVSAMRVEKPHSLSYQLSTRASLPSITWVWGSAKVELAATWLMSMDTMGSLVTASTPFSGPSAAAVMAALISSLVTSRPGVITRSTTDTFGVGTRIE